MGVRLVCTLDPALAIEAVRGEVAKEKTDVWAVELASVAALEAIWFADGAGNEAICQWRKE